LPHLQKIFEEYAKRDVVVLAVNNGDSVDRIRKYFEEEKFTMLPVRQGDAGEISEAYGVMAYPTNYIIAPDGTVAWRGVGFDEEGMREALEKTAAKK
jgi:peroxiredoxin